MEDFLNPTKSLSQPTTKLKEADKYVAGDEITREDMTKLCSTGDLLGRDNREILVWHHSLKNFNLKFIIQEGNNNKEYHKCNNPPPPCFTCIFSKSHKRPWRTKGKHSGGSIRKTSETRPGATNLIDQMISSQPNLTPKATGELTHAILWEATIFLDQ